MTFIDHFICITIICTKFTIKLVSLCQSTSSQALCSTVIVKVFTFAAYYSGTGKLIGCDSASTGCGLNFTHSYTKMLLLPPNLNRFYNKPCFGCLLASLLWPGPINAGNSPLQQKCLTQGTYIVVMTDSEQTRE